LLPLSPRFLLAICLVPAPAASLLQAQEKEAEAFADRWVECTAKGKGPTLERLFTGGATLTIIAQGRKRSCDPQRYTEYLEAALGRLKSHSRERGSVELPEERPGLLAFTSIDRIGTPDGFTIRAETREEFQFGPGGRFERASSYRSTVKSFKVLGAPESWMVYAGPVGLNGFLLEAEFYAPPRDLSLIIAGMVVSLVIVLWLLYRMGLRHRL